MSQINYNELQLIVEKGMRDSGLQGDFEDGWKSVIVDGAGNTVQVKYNFQNMDNSSLKFFSEKYKCKTTTIGLKGEKRGKYIWEFLKEIG